MVQDIDFEHFIFSGFTKYAKEEEYKDLDHLPISRVPSSSQHIYYITQPQHNHIQQPHQTHSSPQI